MLNFDVELGDHVVDDNCSTDDCDIQESGARLSVIGNISTTDTYHPYTKNKVSHAISNTI